MFKPHGFLVICLMLFLCLPACKNPESRPPAPEANLRAFDTALSPSENIRLAILYPSTGSINALRSLREKGLLSIDPCEVIGVFHEAEKINYDRSIQMVQDLGLDWIQFHRLSGELNKENLFQENDVSQDFKSIFEKSDGIIFFGGADIPPYLYGEKTRLLTGIRTPYRHFMELSFVFHLLGGDQDLGYTPLLTADPTFPVLGICLGEQTLNVGTGGSLVQDVWSEVYSARFLEDVIALGRENWHTNPYARLFPEKNLLSYNLHPIRLLPQSRFVVDWGFSVDDTPLIMSAHHQSVEKLGSNIRVIATSLDGKVVESLAHTVFPHVLGVQFHPEFPMLYNPDVKNKLTPEDPEEVSALEILEGNPPSLPFHQKIWAWFAEKLQAHHSAQR